MSGIKKLVGQTAIYGLSSIVGRLLNFLLVPLYTEIFLTHQYGVVSILMSAVAFGLIFLTYGMETAFFHFSNKSESPKKVYSTGFISLLVSSGLFLLFALSKNQAIADVLHIGQNPEYIKWLAWVLIFDVLTTLPFAQLRVENRAWRFASIRLINIGVNIGLNLFFFLLCPYLIKESIAPDWIHSIYDPNMGIGYIFIANLVASATMMLLLLPEIGKIKMQFDFALWKRIINYSFPLLIGGLAYVTNEMADRLLLEYLLPENIATSQVGIYSACYKIAIFMTLFIQAFRYGAEPFFFAQSKSEKAPETYALVMRYFVAFTALIFLAVNVYIDILKGFLRDVSYHEGLDVVPILLLANLFLGMYYNLSIWYKVSEKTRFGAYLSLGGALITISLNIWLIPILGYMGSAWATLACYSAMCLASYLLSKRHYPIPYHWNSILGYLILSMGLFGLWQYWHDEYFVMSSLYCLLYIFIVLGLEKRKKRTIFKH